MMFNYLEVTHINKQEFFHENDGLRVTFYVVLTFICDTKKKANDTLSNPYNVVVKFIDVSSFKFEPMFSDGIGAVQIPGFDLIDISDRLWEGKKYMVEDFENGQIAFYCRDYEVIT